MVENVGGEDEFVRALALDESLRCRTHGGWAQVDEVLLWCSASQKRRQPSRSPVCASSSVLTTVCPGVLPTVTGVRSRIESGVIAAPLAVSKNMGLEAAGYRAWRLRICTEPRSLPSKLGRDGYNSRIHRCCGGMRSATADIKAEGTACAVAQSCSASGGSLVKAILAGRNATAVLGCFDMNRPANSVTRPFPLMGRLNRVLALALWVMVLAACVSESRTRSPIPGQESAPWRRGDRRRLCATGVPQGARPIARMSAPGQTKVPARLVWRCPSASARSGGERSSAVEIRRDWLSNSKGLQKDLSRTTRIGPGRQSDSDHQSQQSEEITGLFRT